ncbi:tripartite tricarboxylate transporter substrate binding protein [Devosia sp. YIM 151766]|uniref:Bug family tripartite tricarboxylate transporter substrate binding protein n=1 Tax=Devosia sp. YIM 151766 TaxID=3017325 RepID=UPI00255C993C|nr:tripartite tricarboxylate transporter substrate binding protein [Devosia sp. YIM 151766]WIY53177.1 tripartite tricarboxylate transporter substrate binding protein [Devosia sp. YIM 151766]
MQRWLHTKLMVVPALVILTAIPAMAQDYPTRPVTLMVGFEPGGSSDILARVLAPHLTEFLGQPIVIENRPGANGAVAAALVANASPDGHTLGIGGSSLLTNALLNPNIGYSLDDLADVAMIGSYSSVMIVPKDLPVTSVDEFQQYALDHAGEMNCGSGGIGSSPHLSCEVVRTALGVEITHITYGGMAPALNDLMANRLQVVFNPIAQTKPFIDEGEVRALAITGAERSDALPDVPTLQELGYDVELSVYTGVYAPNDTPIDVLERINEAIRYATAQPNVIDVLEAGGTIPSDMNLEEYVAYNDNQQQFWETFMEEHSISDE